MLHNLLILVLISKLDGGFGSHQPFFLKGLFKCPSRTQNTLFTWGKPTLLVKLPALKGGASPPSSVSRGHGGLFSRPQPQGLLSSLPPPSTAFRGPGTGTDESRDSRHLTLWGSHHNDVELWCRSHNHRANGCRLEKRPPCPQ
jgi:hypothetical protein